MLAFIQPAQFDGARARHSARSWPGTRRPSAPPRTRVNPMHPRWINSEALSLGGHFAARAAGHETRLATVMASTPFPNPARMFALSVQAAMASAAQATGPPSAAALRGRQVMLWKAGARTSLKLVARSATMVADPARVTVPFLSIVGGGTRRCSRRMRATGTATSVRRAGSSFRWMDRPVPTDTARSTTGRAWPRNAVAGWKRCLLSETADRFPESTSSRACPDGAPNPRPAVALVRVQRLQYHALIRSVPCPLRHAKLWVDMVTGIS